MFEIVGEAARRLFVFFGEGGAPPAKRLHTRAKRRAPGKRSGGAWRAKRRPRRRQGARQGKAGDRKDSGGSGGRKTGSEPEEEKKQRIDAESTVWAERNSEPPRSRRQARKASEKAAEEKKQRIDKESRVLEE